MTDISGLVVPVATPFDEDLKICERALIAHLEFLQENKVSRILANGTTAEFFSLLPDERKMLLEICRRNFSGTLIFNTASDSLEQSLAAGRWAEDCGADAICAMAPYYFAGAPEAGLIDYFNTIAEMIDLPLVLYNFSRHTGNPITPAIAGNVEHAALKDSSGDYSLIDSTPAYFAGSSRTIVEAYEAGAKGFVSAEANHIPEMYVKLESFLKADDLQGAYGEEGEIRNCLGDEGNTPGEIKGYISERVDGYPVRCRLPL